MQFHDKLIQLRKQEGWSQQELGNNLGVSRQTISKWELGETTPELQHIKSLSTMFDISSDELINDDRFGRGAKKSRFRYEFKSKKHVNNMPLVHVNIGMGAYKAKGIIAVGDIATGIICVGLIVTVK